MKNDIIFIHIGKCGGTTIKNSIKKILSLKSPPFPFVHLKQIKYNEDDLYIICIRNPIRRFVSAYNWRKHLLNLRPDKNLAEKLFLDSYKNINELCEQLYINGELNNRLDKNINMEYDHTVKKHPSHLGTSIYWYLKDILKNCSKHNILGIITTENIEEEFYDLFNCNLVKQMKKRNKKYSNYLSKKAQDNLRKYLEKDYECIQKLYDMGCISKKQFNLIYNY